MIIGILMAQETCLILGRVSHNLLYSTKKLLTDIHGPGGSTEKAAYIQARSSVARVMEVNGKERQAEGEAKMGWRQRFILTMQENCEEFISSTLRIRNSKKPSRTHVRNWKRQLLLLCPVKLWRIGEWWIKQEQDKTCVYSGSQWIHKNAYGKLDTIKSRRPHCRKRWEFITASQFGHKFIPVPQANKEWEKLEKIMAWNQTKVKSKKMVIDKARTADSSFRIINGHLSSEKCWIGGKTPKIQRSSCNSEVILWKTTLDLMQYSLSKDLQPSQMTAAKIMDIHFQIARLRWTSSRRSIGSHPS